jgi:asparagine synthase (glutamine-hydrolysing)
MCGITGFFSYANKIDTKKYYEAHLKIVHRGPDDEGFIYKNKNNNEIEHLKGNDTIKEYQNKEHILKKPPSSLILGHRRLSIIDLTFHGHQPYSFNNLYLVYNGEIYNYIELKKELKKAGYKFETDTDTEVFLKAFHYWGIEAFNKFNGMWAAAIYDKQKDELILTRDRFGIKPLYYSLVDNNLIFGSEIKFVASFFNSLYCNEQMVYDYMEYGFIAHSKTTFFKDIYRLTPGSFAIYSKKGFLEKRYYDHLETGKIENKISAVRETLLDSVKLRMRLDVEVGSLLSGGMDSSSIVCAINYLRLRKDFKTFTITYAEKELDYERKYVEDIIKKTHFKNYSVFLEPNVNIIDKLTYIIESPYRSLTENAMYNIYAFIKNNTNITVLLNGEGSDELF